MEFAATVTDRLPEVRARMRAKLLDRIAQLVERRRPRDGSNRNSRSWRSDWTSTRNSTACAAT